MDNWGLIPDRGKDLSPQCPDQLWGLPIFLSSGDLGLFSQDKAASV